MEKSWVMDPGRRPTFSELHKQLDDICKSKLVSWTFNLLQLECYGLLTIELFEYWLI